MKKKSIEKILKWFKSMENEEYKFPKTKKELFKLERLDLCCFCHRVPKEIAQLKNIKKLTVNVKKPSFKLVKSSVKLKKGNKTTIRVKAAPVSKVTYKTSNKKVATVNSKGVVTAKKKGTAKITVKCNGITRTFKVTVK